MKELSKQAQQVFSAIDQHCDVIEWLLHAMQLQAKLCIYGADEFNVLTEMLTHNQLGFDPEYANALLNLIAVAKAGKI